MPLRIRSDAQRLWKMIARAGTAWRGDGAYHPVLKWVDGFLKKPMRAAIELRRERSKALLTLDDQIIQQVKAPKAKGLTSPYVNKFVVARVDPIRFQPKDAAPLSFDEAVDRMATATAKFNPEKIKLEDVARSGGAGDGVEYALGRPTPQLALPLEAPLEYSS